MTPPSYHHKKTNGWPKIISATVRGEKKWMVDARHTIKGRAFGRRFFFEKQADAAAKAAQLRDERALSGLGVHGQLPGYMSDREKADALSALEILRPLRCSLVEAAGLAKEFLTKRRQQHKGPTISKAWEAYLAHKERERDRGEFRPRSFNSLKSAARHILPALGHRKLETLTTPDIMKFVEAIPGAPQTRRSHKVVLSQLFNYARSQGWVQTNPADAVTVKVPNREPQTIRPEKIKKLFAAARAHPMAGQLVPYLGLCAFAGLRPGEAEQLAWDDVHTDTRQVYVRADTSKIKSSRYVDMEPELAALLSKIPRGKGPVIGDSLFQFTRAWQDVRGAAGYAFPHRGINPRGEKWVDDALRHCFGTYWLARHNDRAKLCEQMGNSWRVVGRHYRRAVPRGEADLFWAAAKA